MSNREEHNEHAGPPLSPWPIRLAVLVLLTLLALVAIGIIDRHAMATMHRINHEQTPPPHIPQTR